MKRPVLVLVAAAVLTAAPRPEAQQSRLSSSAVDVATGLTVLTPTPHPPVPHDLAQLWLAPDSGASTARSSPAALAAAAKFAADGDYAKTLGLIAPIARDGPLGQYAVYYAGVAQLHLNRVEDALKSFRSLSDLKPVGYLAEAAALGEAEAQESLDKPAEAVRIYERLLKGRLSDVEDVYMRLGRAAKAAGDPSEAADAFAHVFYEFPLGENAASAGAELEMLTGQQPLTPGTQRYKVELGRAQRLFNVKQYADARIAFQTLREHASGDDKELLQLRVAECDYFMKRGRSALEVLRPLAESASRRAEALFFFALASRAAGDTKTFISTLERVESEFADQTWAEEALNSLGTYYIKMDDDDRADAVFRELYERYPRGIYAERAGWKSGWTAYRNGQYADAARTFERAAGDFPRGDLRPAWLYWAGRAHEQLGETAPAQERFALTAADYANSYYGRLALKRMDPSASSLVAAMRTATDTATPPNQALPTNGAVVRELLAVAMYEDALNELRYAQRVWGDSSAIEATIAWTRQQQSRSESGMRRFQLLRGAINTMRRAYPQFMAAGGEDLPREVLAVIFPIAYWDLIRRHAEANGLDPYFVAALVAQESTFVADVKSGANAYGLMQLLPSTARMYARKLNLRYSTQLLTDPEANISMGTAYLADKVKEFGDLHLVLASYNAGERAVRRWQSERPNLEAEEFIDDIPYPETQLYVRKILGTAEDYRRLYGNGVKVDGIDTAKKPGVAASAAAGAPAAATRKKAPSAKKPVSKNSASKKPASPKHAPSKPAPPKPAASQP